MNIKDLISVGSDFFKNFGVERPRNEAALILSNLLDREYIDLIVNQHRCVSKKNKKVFFKKVFQRLNGKPISRINGYREFYSRLFFLNRHTLDPRPDSETMIDFIKEFEKKNKKEKVKILDLGTGTGCLIISLVLELKTKKVEGVGVDIDCEAVKIAKKNVLKFGLQKKIKIFTSDWFSNVDKKFDIIVSNPPYIKTDQIKLLDKSVKNFDPTISIDGGKDGLESYRAISNLADFFLKENGYICFELGLNQKRCVESIFSSKAFDSSLLKRDLAKKERIIVFKKKLKKKNDMLG